jgi:hypothetical protein
MVLDDLVNDDEYDSDYACGSDSSSEDEEEYEYKKYSTRKKIIVDDENYVDLLLVAGDDPFSSHQKKYDATTINSLYRIIDNWQQELPEEIKSRKGKCPPKSDNKSAFLLVNRIIYGSFKSISIVQRLHLSQLLRAFIVEDVVTLTEPVINVNVSSHLSTVERDIIDILTSNPGVSRSILLNSLMQQNEEIKLTMSINIINNTGSTIRVIQKYFNEQLEKMKREEKIIIINDGNDNNNSKLYLKIN